MTSSGHYYPMFRNFWVQSFLSLKRVKRGTKFDIQIDRGDYQPNCLNGASLGQAMQQLTRFQLALASRGPSATDKPLVLLRFYAVD